MRKPKPKGHWPRGKRRNADTDSKEVRRLLTVAAGKRMGAEVSRRLGVPRKTLWRWMTGVDVPTVAVAKRLADIIGG